MRVACLRALERNMGGYRLRFCPVWLLPKEQNRLKEACEAQTYFRSSFGGREATTGNTSALRRLC